MQTTSRIAAVLSIMLVAGAAFAADGATSYGQAVSAQNAQRVIVVKPDTKWVNVNNGDTVEFQLNGASVTWSFNTLQGESAFDLSKIAPAGSLDHKVTVYVGANPLYRG
jgi:plastocyanin